MSSPSRLRRSLLVRAIWPLSCQHIDLGLLHHEQTAWLSAPDKNHRRLRTQPPVCLAFRPVNLARRLLIPLLDHRPPLRRRRRARATSNMCKLWSTGPTSRTARPLLACPVALSTDVAHPRRKHQLDDRCRRWRLLVVRTPHHLHCIRLAAEWAMHHHLRRQHRDQSLLSINGRWGRVRLETLPPRRRINVYLTKDPRKAGFQGHCRHRRNRLSRPNAPIEPVGDVEIHVICMYVLIECIENSTTELQQAQGPVCMWPTT